ncbi:hypothetical protein CLU88_1606 [Acidovorax sp. 56]|uniref:hypothetical protein n=1 Tax=Acidovorax sp. 56 TaxID=2035205 RepID=UPI000C611B69|nr:hypothetical protein [Acidovorax sp. 56]PIF26735.1 hypothetical protein CLU88_1606 [Acidovorax sp. 56]
MSEQVSVCEYAPVDQAKSKWLNNILLPLVDACRFERKIEVTISPLHTGKYPCAGMSPVRHFRGLKPFIYLSGQYQFWRKETIACIYLHECAHKLIDIAGIKRNEYPKESHGPIFLLVEMVLFNRADQASNLEHKLFSRINFYDFSDQPYLPDEASEHEYIWRPLVLQFALSNYESLANSDLSAEQIAEKAWDLWDDFRIDKIIIENRKNKEIEELEKSKSQLREQNSKLRNQLTAFIMLIFVLPMIGVGAYLMSLLRAS